MNDSLDRDLDISQLPSITLNLAELLDLRHLIHILHSINAFYAYLPYFTMGLFGGKTFAPEKDIPNLEGKVILVTGGM